MMDAAVGIIITEASTQPTACGIKSTVIQQLWGATPVEVTRKTLPQQCNSSATATPKRC